MTYDVVAHVASLEDMSIPDLQAYWERLFNKKATTVRKSYLISHLAYRIQELAYGGLSDAAEETLDAMVSGDIDLEKQNKRLCMPPVGTKLVREYQGNEHHVTVTRSGFEYQGRTFKSLSEIARLITGTRWSGPLFFGLKDSAQTTKNTKKD